MTELLKNKKKIVNDGILKMFCI